MREGGDAVEVRDGKKARKRERGERHRDKLAVHLRGGERRNAMSWSVAGTTDGLPPTGRHALQWEGPQRSGRQCPFAVEGSVVRRMFQTLSKKQVVSKDQLKMKICVFGDGFMG